tara:strand:- start:83 stop:694 length:612 start_codon:yes stop_codon:yes gene_type:complete
MRRLHQQRQNELMRIAEEVKSLGVIARKSHSMAAMALERSGQMLQAVPADSNVNANANTNANANANAGVNINGNANANAHAARIKGENERRAKDTHQTSSRETSAAKILRNTNNRLAKAADPPVNTFSAAAGKRKHGTAIVTEAGNGAKSGQKNVAGTRSSSGPGSNNAPRKTTSMTTATTGSKSQAEVEKVRQRLRDLGYSL